MPDKTVLGGTIEVDDKSLIKNAYKSMPENSGAEIVILDDSHVMVSKTAQ
jgi:hypothetical protein